MKIKQTIIGIDPGATNGGIALLKQTSEGMKLETHKMPSKFIDIVNLLKPHAGIPGDTQIRCSIEQINMRPGQSSFITARMQPLMNNVNDIKNALTINNIGFQEVAPVTWQKWHNLVLPKETEKGVDYESLHKLKKELKQIEQHKAIENRLQNDVVISENVKHILETSGKKEARKALNDRFTYFSKYDLNVAVKEIEKEVEKILNHEKRVRKNRYKALASKYAMEKATLWNCDAILLLMYQKYNSCQK